MHKITIVCIRSAVTGPGTGREISLIAVLQELFTQLLNRQMKNSQLHNLKGLTPCETGHDIKDKELA